MAAGGTVLFVLVVVVCGLVWRMRHQDRVRRTLEIKAAVDPLTGALNRAGGMAALKAMIQRCDRARIKMVLCYVDINRLKTVNDTLGHQEGDRYIRLVADTITGCVRDRDVVARIGGDEFLLALYNHTSDSVGRVIQRVSGRLEQQGNSDAYPYPVGASFGVAVYNSSVPCPVDTLLEQADTDMYKNKNQDRQR